jgi:hypothetical protein
MPGLDRADRAALGLLLVIWEPLMILSIVSAGACMLTMANMMRRYGPRESYVWVFFALTLASFAGVIRIRRCRRLLPLWRSDAIGG